jgi:hypothetical protein
MRTTEVLLPETVTILVCAHGIGIAPIPPDLTDEEILELLQAATTQLQTRIRGNQDGTTATTTIEQSTGDDIQ